MPPLNESQTISTRDPIGRVVVGTPVTIAEKLTLRAVAAVLAGAGIGAALVERDDGTVGIVSERDITRALADEADPDVVWSADVMSERLVSAGSDEPILRVAFRMIDEGIRHIGIVDNDEITGIVSLRDLFEILAEHALETQ